jgi:hypothetical protein
MNIPEQHAAASALGVAQSKEAQEQLLAFLRRNPGWQSIGKSAWKYAAKLANKDKIELSPETGRARAIAYFDLDDTWEPPQ